jgi:hypothetical protein
MKQIPIDPVLGLEVFILILAVVFLATLCTKG